jgi:hypothetical protein
LRGAGAAEPAGLVVGVVETGGEALTLGVFSHGGQGGTHSPLPGGGYDGEPGGDAGGAIAVGPVVGVLRLSGAGGGADGGEGDRDRAWNEALPSTG